LSVSDTIDLFPPDLIVFGPEDFMELPPKARSEDDDRYWGLLTAGNFFFWFGVIGCALCILAALFEASNERLEMAILLFCLAVGLSIVGVLISGLVRLAVNLAGRAR
jgi:hypothetical protein